MNFRHPYDDLSFNLGLGPYVDSNLEDLVHWESLEYIHTEYKKTEVQVDECFRILEEAEVESAKKND